MFHILVGDQMLLFFVHGVFDVIKFNSFCTGNNCVFTECL